MQIMHKFADALTERVGNPLEWSSVDKGIMLALVVLPLYGTYLAWAQHALNLEHQLRIFNHEGLLRIRYFLVAVLTATSCVGLLGFLQRRRRPNSPLFEYLSVQFYTVCMTLLGYQIGSLSITPGIVLAGSPLLGFIFFDRKAVLTGFATAIVILFGTTYLSARGYIDYAPILQANGATAGTFPMFWLRTTLLIYALPHLVLLLSLSAWVIQRWHRREEEVKQLSLVDPLTQISNRRQILMDAERELMRARRLGTSLSLVMVDLDHFKGINDNHGHQVGDLVLRTSASLIAGTVRESDMVGRYGGEEFLLVLPDTALPGAREVAERCRQHLEETHLSVEGLADLKISGSFGLASTDGCMNCSAEQLIQAADAALYRAKEQGRNRVVAGVLSVA